jgi:hypothetical protein
VSVGAFRYIDPEELRRRRGIITRWTEGESQKSIAKSYGVSTGIISTLICNFIVEFLPEECRRDAWQGKLFPKYYRDDRKPLARRAMMKAGHDIIWERNAKTMERLRRQKERQAAVISAFGIEPFDATALYTRCRSNGRVIDMGGPRDVWLTFELGKSDP